jgi:glycosyltransferase involved in cell wall biosynthesis
MIRQPRALVYGDVDLNLIDGSAIWAQSMVQALSLAGCETRLLLKAPVDTGRLVDAIADLANVTIVRPYEQGLLPDLGRTLSAVQASRLLQKLDEDNRCDLLVVRGRRAVSRIVADGHFGGRVWAYLTDIPQSAVEMTEDAVRELTRIAEASRYLLCQTEELRCHIETWIPAACGRCLLYPPSVPTPEFSVDPQKEVSDPIRLVYTGKFAPAWNTLEMTRLPTALADRGVSAELHTVGDKIHRDPAQPDFHDRMTQSLRSSHGVVHHGGTPRQEAMRIASTCDIGLGWRDPQLDSSLELSTKLLEFGSVGLPVVLNRTPAHEALLGADYPLFVNPPATLDVAADAISAAVLSPEALHLAASRCRAAAEEFSLARSTERLRTYLARALPTAPSLTGRDRPLRLLVAGHDLKFFTRLLDHFGSVPEIQLRVDAWPALSKHDPAISHELAEWADVVVVEWCGPAAVWYSRHKRRGSRLLVRLHRFELYAGWPAQVDINAVDRVVCVSDSYARFTLAQTNWPAEKVVTISNWVDIDQLDRPKVPGARFRLGMIGIAPSRKRLDLGVEVLSLLRARDPRWQLSLKSKMPWEYWWIWNKPEERAHYDRVLDRIQTDPVVDGGVVFDSFGPDVASWLRRIGYVLSTSDDESFHLSPAEGMASGAVPAILPWPGADTIYDPRWIHDSPAAMADAIAALAADGWEDAAAAAKTHARTSFDLKTISEMWTSTLAELTNLTVSGTEAHGPLPSSLTSEPDSGRLSRPPRR